MRCENMANNRTMLPSRHNFVAITSCKVQLWLWKSLEDSEKFLSYFVAILDVVLFCHVIFSINQ